MTGLFQSLAQGRDLGLLWLALSVAAVAAYCAQHVLGWGTRWGRSRHDPRRVLKFAVALPLLGLSSWLVYVLTAAGFFPHLAPAAHLGADVRAFVIATLGGLAAGTIAVKARPGYRDLLLGGAVLAASTACMVFLSLSTLTRPYRLAYDLLPVTATVLLAAILNGLGLAQGAGKRTLAQRMQGASCLAAAQVLLNVAGLASILSFSDWMAMAHRPVNLATAPLVVVLAACGLVVLVLGIGGSAIDYHFNSQNERESDRLRQLADSALEGILIHRKGLVVDANAAFCALVGCSLEDLRGRDVAALSVPDDHSRLFWGDEQAEAPYGQQETGLRADDGSYLPVEVLPRRLTYKGEPAWVVAIRDLRERREAEAQILHLAHHDGLTGLANRMKLSDRFELALAMARRTHEPIAVICLDLDRFKAVNDGLGHQAGDLVLQQVAQRLTASVRTSDTVARTGGDEFVILQTSGPQPQTARMLAARLVQLLSAPFELDRHQATIGVSIGIALYPNDGASATELLKRADVALYRAKAGGRRTFSFYEAGMDTRLRDRQALERDLRSALGTGQLEMHYQPVITCDGTETVTGLEALMRWEHPVRGTITPTEFIPLAEETGLILPLGRWALQTALAEAAAWPVACRVAVNLSPAQFRDTGLTAMVAEALAQTGLLPARLELEVTEGLLISDTDQALAALVALKSLGVRLVLDDFGTGYSSLSYLRLFPFDKLKIDKSFVQTLGTSAGADAIVEAILAMSRSLGLEVTAEGVETQQQLSALLAQSCTTVQGFLLGRPMPARFVAAYLAPAPPIRLVAS